MNELEFIDLQIKLLTDRREKLLMKQKLNKQSSSSPKIDEVNEGQDYGNYKRTDCCGRRIFNCDCDLYGLRKFTPH